MSTITSARDRAGQNFKEGYNCAEAILRAFRDVLNLELSDAAIRIASGFGGGLGHAGCMCGALTASVMVISLLQGRVSKEESREPVYQTTREFHERFAAKFGATCCRVLNSHPFDTREHLRNCLKITGITASLLEEFLREKELMPGVTN
ncbi:C-GCAxxG-C-C family (seleno)protein [Sporolituus thermophilus]|uniref:C_GCAxxG_C_C family probable redox protein n=1 Tax=Sporolituus thermophilus DSM 23256 TaxID=1123285 RepID=A0A1G7LGF4_9FIRM|nr:C-GCAxxG-C-C family (seleno)protein [Sporolituus thermophilus]SDF48607.1 C_GCAxxG_C_C family probable redox protein [Sporolituus thermophilus DSM 23256]